MTLNLVVTRCNVTFCAVSCYPITCNLHYVELLIHDGLHRHQMKYILLEILNMDFHMHCYYKVNEYFLSAAGMWPYQTKKKKILLCSIITFSILSIHVAQVIASEKTITYYLIHYVIKKFLFILNFNQICIVN